MIKETLKRGPAGIHAFTEDRFPSALEYEVNSADLSELAISGRIKIGRLNFLRIGAQYHDLCEEIDSEALQKSIESELAGVLCFFSNKSDDSVAYFVEGLETIPNPETGDYFIPEKDVPLIMEIINKRRSNKSCDDSKKEDSILLRRKDDPDISYLRYVHEGLKRNGSKYREWVFDNLTRSFERFSMSREFCQGVEYYLMSKPKNMITALYSFMLCSDMFAEDKGNQDGVRIMFTEFFDEMIEAGLKNTRMPYDEARPLYNQIIKREFSRESSVFGGEGDYQR
ncbi:hypothetical protein GF345_01685 [Candidatus Woesearchaeota archaeon]|nr:hypothetical protein [Candidatus Woesearchaeota archaeon]